MAMIRAALTLARDKGHLGCLRMLVAQDDFESPSELQMPVLHGVVSVLVSEAPVQLKAARATISHRTAGPTRRWPRGYAGLQDAPSTSTRNVWCAGDARIAVSFRCTRN